MRADFTPLAKLEGEQLFASDPANDVWLSASAGTGKTHVLTARVLRLLLRPHADPSAILCLTFTKAGAAEMAERVNSRLARWVRLPTPDLRRELDALGEDHLDDAVVARARTLFARVLEAPGGLRIGTIHAFAQGLLASFPAEAGLAPGFRAIEAREAQILARETLATLVLDAEAAGDPLIGQVQAMSLRLGEGGAEAWLQRCAAALPALDRLPPAIGPYVRRALDLPEGDVTALVAAGCAALDEEALGRIASAYTRWGTATGAKRAASIAAFLALEDRAAGLDELASTVLTGKGERFKSNAKLVALDAHFDSLCDALGEACNRLKSLATAVATADLITAGLTAGRRYARAYAAAKRRAGLVDFDDLIHSVSELLYKPDMGAWIRYRLDQRTDHILVDEGQDTNARQWSIVRALADEFFSGEGARTLRRTLFSVGDHKQAIFGFQGTDPLFFRAAETLFDRLIVGDGDDGRRLHRRSLSRSFRSSPPVLAVVDAVIAGLGAEALGLADPPPLHLSARGGSGRVSLLAPVIEDRDEDAGGEEGWVDDATRLLAKRIARQIRRWLDDGLMLDGKGRALRPGDIMILVRRRSTLAALIVARLHAERVPVAGVDRLTLGAPLAVQDLLSAVRFAVQPDDDLNLAGLLVSPLIGWTQERLWDVGHDRRASLWQRVRTSGDPAASVLGALLDQADFGTPYAFLETILSGPLDGRRRLLARLGAEARDPIDELLGAALAFERTATPGLQRFLDWLDRGEVEIVRDPSQPGDAVRVMTVHGAKGLQAPLVILADATVDPARSPRRGLAWDPEEGADALPLFPPRKDERFASLARDAETAERRDMEEHWRLLYVAATRAEEHLVVAGALGPMARGEVPQTSWHAAIGRALAALEARPEEDPIWGSAVTLTGGTPRPRRAEPPRAAPSPLPERPAWLDRAAPLEARPARPPSPSAPGEDESVDPPPGPAMRAAAERGRLLHALFERLPGVAPTDRRAAAIRWLEGAGGAAPGTAPAIADAALAVIETPALASLFGPQALAEAPIAAVVDGIVVAGTVDRLLVTDRRVTLVDFKTGRRVPASPEEVPLPHRRQMAAYKAALEAIFPGRTVEARLLYTGGPTLIALDDAALDPLRPGAPPPTSPPNTA